MNDHRTYFGCRHPIVCAAMNQVSDARLAIAVQRAGAFPSLSVANYVEGDRFDLKRFEAELSAFQDATGSSALLLSVGSQALLHDAILRPFLDRGFRHFELFHWAAGEPSWPRVRARAGELERCEGAKVLFKISTGHLRADLDYGTIVLKGPEGAGRSADDALPLDEAFVQCRRELPATAVVVSGGIHGPAQLHAYLERGALAAAIGSLFAASVESAVDDSVKRKIVAAGAADLERRGRHGLQGLYAGDTDATDNANLTRTLKRGVRDAQAGGIFVGSAIEHITSILPVQAIVDHLVGAAPAAA
jgi:NAD(P)H-dependent flavin oxidoreductase YrpB (nitropropane dioxygenase family)